MKFEDVGINPETGRHNRQLTTTENRFLGILWTDHAGADNKISNRQLARKFARTQGEHIGTGPGWEKALQTWMREVRRMQNHLLFEHDNIPLLSKAGNNGGYWMAESEFEAAEFFGAFRQRGLTGLKKAANGKQALLVDMVRQLSFEFDDLEDQTGQKVETIAGRATAVEVVYAHLRKMFEDPERFHGDLMKIHRTLSSVLMPKERVRKAAQLTAQLNELMAGWI